MIVLILEALAIILLIYILYMLLGAEKLRRRIFVPRARVEEYWDGRERRRHVRFKKALEVVYKVERRAHLKNGRTVDISEGGMKLCVDDKLLKGAIVALEVDIPDLGKTAQVEGEVMWSEDADIKDDSGKRYFHSGIRFIAIKEPPEADLAKYIRSLPSDLKT